MGLEDFEDAARLKVAIAAAATNDSVGRVISYLNVRTWTHSVLLRKKALLYLLLKFCAFLLMSFSEFFSRKP